MQDQGKSGRCSDVARQSFPRTHAYRYGGFGTHEIVLFTTDRHAPARNRMPCRSFCDADRGQEICHLEQLQQEWLHQPQAELYDQSRRR